MAAVYVALIIKGRKEFHQVPDRIKNEVAELLVSLECAYLIDEDGYLPQIEG